MPQRPSAATSPTILRASRGSRPPGSGQPVPGTKPACAGLARGCTRMRVDINGGGFCAAWGRQVADGAWPRTSMTSMSKERYTASQPSHARSSAISTTFSGPRSSTSEMEKMLVRRSRMMGTAARGTCAVATQRWLTLLPPASSTLHQALPARCHHVAALTCQPPMPICTRFSGRTLGMLVA
eukprot:scaffold140770_cov31-Tisochrysis_lutea.AAC.2